MHVALSRLDELLHLLRRTGTGSLLHPTDLVPVIDENIAQPLKRSAQRNVSVLKPPGARRRAPQRRPNRRRATGQGRTSTKPAALKSPSNARASAIRSRRMISKLVASTYE